jgi:pimeloyl-ACP methyl ester carboxylesterase
MTITYIETAGGKLAVEVEGEGPRLVICSPGMGDTRDAYGPVAAELVKAGYRVARMDIRGHGDSSANFKSYGDEAIADDYLTLITALGGGPAVLAGASLSAGAAVIAAGREPKLVAGIVLLGPFLRVGASKLVVSLMQIMFWRPWGPLLWRLYANTLWPGLGEAERKKRASRSSDLLTRPGHWSAFQATLHGADHNTAVTPWISRVQAPALVVIGDKDPDWSDPLEEAAWVASRFSGSETLVVHGAGHAPQYESPDVVAPGMLKFLEKIKFN